MINQEGLPSSYQSHDQPSTSQASASDAEDLPTSTAVHPEAQRSHSLDDDNLMCRVCRGNEGHLYHPCLCTGSIKYVHQECLTEWLKYSKKEVCELCNYKYSFQAIYRPDMPKALPLRDIVRGVGLSVYRMMRTWFIYSIVLVAWLGVVPLTAARIYNTVFYATIQEVLSYPSPLFRTDHILADCFKGSCLLTLFICTFISLVWLREQIIHGGPQDFLNIPNQAPAQQQEDPDNAPPPQNENENQGDEDGAEEEESDDDDVDSSDEEVGEDDMPVIDEEVARLHEGRQFANDDDDYDDDEADDRLEQLARDLDREEDEEDDNLPGAVGGPANEARDQREGGEAQQDENWRDNWDRFGGDDLTWQRLLGLDGSFIFLEHVVWVIMLSTLFTVFFAYLPYKLGYFLLSSVGVQQNIYYFPSVAAILSGYLTLAFLFYLAHAVAGFFRLETLFRFLGISFLVIKVFLLVLLEIGLFPIICGTWIDLCAMTLFSSTLSSRTASFVASPISGIFLRWLIGMVYVFYSASFVLLLREVLRPGVLWFLRNLNDPEFNPIQEMIELPVSRHVQRIVASTSLFFSTIFLVVYLPLRIVKSVAPSCLPYNVSWSAETPLSELSLELLFLQVLLPGLLEQTQARTLLKSAVRIWCECVGGVLNLSRYLLPEQPPPEPPRINAAQLAAEGVVGGGLAAEHQALLLVREPNQPNLPYEKPSWFALRVIALIATMAVTWTLSSAVCFYLPVTIGRVIVKTLFGISNIHDLYTVATGLYVLWMFAKFFLFCLEWFTQDVNQMRTRIFRTVSLSLRILVLVIPVVGIIPILLGTYFQLVLISPLRLEQVQTPLYFTWQDWAMGVLHLKIGAVAILMGPDWWLKEALDRIYNDGLTNIRVAKIMVVVVLPVTLALGSLIAIPYLVAEGMVWALEGTPKEELSLHRAVYPISCLAICFGLFLNWQYHKFKGLTDEIRNEKYLVGTQLVNYNREQVKQENSEPETEPAPVE